jgi:hypothetical protein
VNSTLWVIDVSSAVYCIFTWRFLYTYNQSSTARKVYPNNVDCGSVGDLGGKTVFCVSNFNLPATKSISYGVMMKNISDIWMRGVVCGNDGIFLSYNYTGPDWSLCTGLWIDQ